MSDSSCDDGGLSDSSCDDGGCDGVLATTVEDCVEFMDHAMYKDKESFVIKAILFYQTNNRMKNNAIMHIRTLGMYITVTSADIC